jgi:hypothetical protein
MTAAANPIRVVISISEWQPGKVVPSLETFI